MNGKIPITSGEQMENQVETLVLRRLRGELDASGAERLAAALAADPSLESRAAALERSWRELELPPYAGASVAPQILARLRAEQSSAVPGWARLAAAAALVAGIGLGVGLDRGLDGRATAPEDLPEIVDNGEADLFGDEDDLAGEDLWLAAEADWLDEGEVQ